MGLSNEFLEASLEHNRRLTALLREPKNRDPEWQSELDKTFVKCVFHQELPQPCFLKFGMPYFGFHWPVGTINPTLPSRELAQIVELATGAAVLNPEGETSLVYSAGDMLALDLYGTAGCSWGPSWEALPDHAAYLGKEILAGPPNSDMLPPPVARHLEFAMRRLFKTRGNPDGRAPSVLLVRPKSYDDPSQPSDLLLNLSPEQFGGDAEGAGKALALVGWYVPRHIGKRIMLIPGLEGRHEFIPLADIMRTAGLEPVVEY